MTTINDINFKGKKALVRVDFNVPMNKEMIITDDSRIKAALTTITKIFILVIGNHKLKKIHQII